MGGTLANIMKQNYWLKTYDEKKIREAIKEGSSQKEQRKKVTKVRKDTLKPYTNVSKPYFRAITQANATFRPNNGARTNTYSSEKLC